MLFKVKAHFLPLCCSGYSEFAPGNSYPNLFSSYSRAELLGFVALHELAVEAAVIRVIDWRGLSEGGKELPFSKENAERILAKHEWIREQIQEEAGQVVNFS